MTGLLLVIGLATAAVVALVRAVLRIRLEEREADRTGIQCQGCLQDVKVCCCPLSVER